MFEAFTQHGDDDSGETRVRLDGVRANQDESSSAHSRHSAEGDTSAARVGRHGKRAGRLVEQWDRVPGRGRIKPVVLGVGTAVVVALLTGVVVLGDDPESRRVPPPRLSVADEVSSTASTTSTPTSHRPERVVVSVVGNVATPGLVTLTSGARVAAAVRAAGGASDASERRSVNLARRVVDGEQLYIGVAAPPDASQPSGNAAGSTQGDDVVGLNTAGAERLQTLPGIGPVTAERIIAWRTENGGFDGVRQLRQVDGIGRKRLTDLRELVRVR